MHKVDLKRALTAIEPKTKAAKLREVMPVIEQRIAAGVRIADIVKTLQDSGIDLTEATLKSYLYRHRKKKGKNIGRQSSPTSSSPSDFPTSTETDSSQTPTSHGPISMLELDRLMKPDPATQAEEMAYYERLARQNRRGRKR